MKSLSLKVIIHIIFTLFKIFRVVFSNCLITTTFYIISISISGVTLGDDILRHVKTYVTKNKLINGENFIIEGPVSYTFENAYFR